MIVSLKWKCKKRANETQRSFCPRNGPCYTCGQLANPVKKSAKMSPISTKRAVCLAGGLLFIVVGCQSSSNEFDPPDQTLLQISPQTTGEVVAQTTIQATDTPPPSITPSPSASPTATITPTPTLEPMPIPTPDGPPYVYHTISSGETLGYLAQVYETTLEELAAMNKLSGPDALIQTGQLLRVPTRIDNIAPNTKLLPDSEVVYGPGYVGFDVADFVKKQGGYLVTYEEYVDNELLTGAQIIERVAEQFSVGPAAVAGLIGALWGLGDPGHASRGSNQITFRPAQS